MRIRKPGKIFDGLWMFGREESCIYLLEGSKESMIISGGIGYIVPDVIQQFEAFGIDEERIKKLLILHGHFDHTGIVPFMRTRIPEMEILASSRAWELLGQQKVLETLNKFNRLVAGIRGMSHVYDGYDLDWKPGITGTPLSEGDQIDIGNMMIDIYETPGHSSCSISGYVPQIKTLFPSDGGGIPYKDIIIPPGNSNYTKFQQSLEKLKDLDLNYFCADHYGYITGEEATNYLEKSIIAAKARRDSFEEAYLSTKDIDSAALKVAEEFRKEHPDYIIPPEINRGVYRQMIRHIAQAIENS